jgi:hypothetical protein
VTRRHEDVARGTPRLLALDVSSKCVGWAVFDGELPIAFGQQNVVGRDHGEKLAWFIAWLMEQFDTHDVTDVCVEKPYPAREKYAFGVLQQYFGAVLCAHFMYFGYELPDANRVAASQVKHLNQMPHGGRYEENKANAVQLVNSLYQLQLKYDPADRAKAVSQDDTADALLVGRAWWIQRHG